MPTKIKTKVKDPLIDVFTTPLDKPLILKEEKDLEKTIKDENFDFEADFLKRASKLYDEFKEDATKLPWLESAIDITLSKHGYEGVYLPRGNDWNLHCYERERMIL